MTSYTERSWKFRGIRPCTAQGQPCRFAVTLERGEDCISDLQLEAAELLDYATFRAHVLQARGRLVRFAEVEDATDPAAAWLDLVEAALPEGAVKAPVSGFRPSPPPRHRKNGAILETAEIGGGD